MNISEFPLIKTTFFFILGILFAFYIQPNILTVTTLLFLISIVLVCIFLKYNKIESNQIPFGIVFYSIFFLIGITTTIATSDTFTKNHYYNNENNFKSNHTFTLTILEKLKKTSKNDRYYALVSQINESEASGKILLNCKNDSLSVPFVVGSRLLVDDFLIKNFVPNNPSQFDYGKYLETKGVYGQIFTDCSHIKRSNVMTKNLFYYTAKFRNTIQINLEKAHFNKKELSVILALILGQQQDISPDVLQDYQFAGAVHILSVSGLHVGFILVFLTFLLQPLPNTRGGNFIRFVIVIICLWLFALVAGLAPSVIRSATMFSFLALGMFISRETNMFHTTFISLFLILLVKPLFLFDIGFQLSYLALFFILWLQPLLKQLWTPNNSVITYFWDILTVSFAAQIGALPLSIYYFHQFPGLFFVTNLVLIPCLTLIMALGTLLMFFAYFDIIPMYLSKTVEWCVFFMNKFINYIASIESFVIKEIPLNFLLLLVSYLLIFVWILWFKKPSFYKLFMAIFSIFLFQILYFSTQYSTSNKSEFIVFNVSKSTLFAERKGKEIFVFSSKKLLESDFEYKMLQSYCIGNYCNIQSIKPITNVYSFNGKNILVIDKSSVYQLNQNPDIIVLSYSPKFNLDRFLEKHKPKVIIADGSNYKTYIEAWKNTCLKAKIPFHSTYEKGFYKLR